MRLKKQYDPIEIEAWEKSGRQGQTPKPTHVVVQNLKDIQRFDPDLLQREAANGIISIAGGKIIWKTADGQDDVAYKIVRVPGMYCCHCGQQQSDSGSAKLHVIEFHSGDVSPDQNNPSGYCKDNWFTCKLEK